MKAKPKRFLIVHEKLGSGHTRMARLLERMLLARGGAVVTSVAGSELLGSTSADAVVLLWNSLIRRGFIRTADVLLNGIARSCALPVVELSDTPRLFEKLEPLAPDVIISTADGFNKALGMYAASRGIPFFIFVTELSTFADLVHPTAVHVCYLPETAAAINSYDFASACFALPVAASSGALAKLRYLRGCLRPVVDPLRSPGYRGATGDAPVRNAARTMVVGPLAEERYFESKDRVRLRERLGLPVHHDTVLVVSGSLGGEPVLDAARRLRNSYEGPLTVLAMCGNDARTYRALTGLGVSATGVSVRPYAFVDNMDDFLALSDCVVARPSASIFTESLITKTPIVTLVPVTSNDRGALDIVARYGTGEICATRGDLPGVVRRVLGGRARYRENIGRLLERTTPSYEEKAGRLLSAFFGHVGRADAPLGDP